MLLSKLFYFKIHNITLNSLAVSKIKAQAQVDITYVQLQERTGRERRIEDGKFGRERDEAAPSSSVSLNRPRSIHQDFRF